MRRPTDPNQTFLADCCCLPYRNGCWPKYSEDVLVVFKVCLLIFILFLDLFNGHVFSGAHNCTKTAPECVDRKAMFDRKAGLGPRMEVWQCSPFFLDHLLPLSQQHAGDKDRCSYYFLSAEPLFLLTRSHRTHESCCVLFPIFDL